MWCAQALAPIGQDIYPLLIMRANLDCGMIVDISELSAAPEVLRTNRDVTSLCDWDGFHELEFLVAITVNLIIAYYCPLPLCLGGFDGARRVERFRNLATSLAAATAMPMTIRMVEEITHLCI